MWFPLTQDKMPITPVVVLLISTNQEYMHMYMQIYIILTILFGDVVTAAITIYCTYTKGHCKQKVKWSNQGLCMLQYMQQHFRNQPLCHIWHFKYFQLKQDTAQHSTAVSTNQHCSEHRISLYHELPNNPLKYIKICMCIAMATT